MGNTNVQPEIQAEAHFLIILPKDDQQGNHLRINTVSVLRQIYQISLTDEQIRIPLQTHMGNTNVQQEI